MASIIFQRRLANIEAMKKAGENTETSTQALTFADKNKMAWSLVKSGEAKNLKEAWGIIKTKNQNNGKI